MAPRKYEDVDPGEIFPGSMIGDVPTASLRAERVAGPLLRTAIGGAACVALAAGLGVGKGYLFPSISVKETYTTNSKEQPARAEVRDISFNLSQVPVVGFVSHVENSKATVSRKASVGIGPLKGSIPLGANSVTYEADLDASINYEATSLTAAYDPNTHTADIIVPLTAFSVSASPEPTSQHTTPSDDLLSWPANLADAVTKSLTITRNVPGIAQLAESKNGLEDRLGGYAQLFAVQGVAHKCVPELTKNSAVWEKLHEGIAEDALPFMEAADPKLNKSDYIHVYIGAENKNNPIVMGQTISTKTNVDSDVAAIKAQEGIDLSDTKDTFECTLSPDLRKKLTTQENQSTRTSQTTGTKE